MHLFWCLLIIHLTYMQQSQSLLWAKMTELITEDKLNCCNKKTEDLFCPLERDSAVPNVKHTIAHYCHTTTNILVFFSQRKKICWISSLSLLYTRISQKKFHCHHRTSSLNKQLTMLNNLGFTRFSLQIHSTQAWVKTLKYWTLGNSYTLTSQSPLASLPWLSSPPLMLPHHIIIR